MAKVLLTGGAGFAGYHIAKELKKQGHDVTSLDCLTYAADLSGLTELGVPNICADFSEHIPLHWLGHPDYIVHNAAESHVTSSIQNPGLFVNANILGTLNMLEIAKVLQPKRFIYVSTDEVFGPASDTPYREADALRPMNPYAATKAGGEYIARSYWRCFGLPVMFTRTCNMFGERQHPEKFVPLVIKKLLNNEVVEIHTSETGELGSRYWVHASEQGRAIAWLLENGNPGWVYHVAEGTKLDNLGMARQLAGLTNQVLCFRKVKNSRAVRDLHYAIQPSVEAMAWNRPDDFGKLLEQTVRWYEGHREWFS